MRIGLVLYGSLESLSGGYLYDRKLVTYLQQRGDQVNIISLPWRNYSAHLQDNYSKTLLTRLAKCPIDVLIQDELNHASLFRINRKLRKRTRYPILSIVHHLRTNEKHKVWKVPLYRFIERRYLQSVDGFIYNSATTRQSVIELVKEERPGVIAYPSGSHIQPTVSPLEVEQRARQKGPLKLLFLGNVIARKGLHNLLSALAQSPVEQFSLTIIGRLDVDLRYTRKVQNQVVRMDLGNRVCFTGRLDNRSLNTYLRTSHMLVIPSTYEGFGIAYLEGMGFGLPGIGTTAGGAGEVITHGENGFLVNSDDPQMLAEALQSLYHNRTQLIAMSHAAMRRYAAHPTWETSFSKVYDFIHEM